MGLTGERRREYDREYKRKQRLDKKVGHSTGLDTPDGRGLTELPESIIQQINDLVEYRVSLGLPGDKEQRVEGATEYHVWNGARLAERCEYMRNHPRKELQAVS